MTEVENNVAGFWELFSELSAVCRSLVLVGAIFVMVCVVFAVIVTAYILHRRGAMVRYSRFLETTYGAEPVPVLLYRYWVREVELYNRARRRWPWRLVWREACAERFALKEPKPSRPVSGRLGEVRGAVPKALAAQSPDVRRQNAALHKVAEEAARVQTPKPASALAAQEKKDMNNEEVWAEEVREDAAPSHVIPPVDNTMD